MPKLDRGTVLFLRLYLKDTPDPIVIDVARKHICGLILDGIDLSHSFDQKVLIGAPSLLAKNSVSCIYADGYVDKVASDIVDFDDIEKIWLTLVYPDGSTKVTERSGDALRSPILWDDALIRKLKQLKIEDFWTDDWRTNPALVTIEPDGSLAMECTVMPGCGPSS